MKIAIIQLNSGTDSAGNLERVRGLFSEAIKPAPDVVLLPEYSNYSGPLEHAYEHAESEGGEWTEMLSFLAESGRVCILAGILEKAGEGKAASSVWSFDPSGRASRKYVKMHLFDADSIDGRSIRESRYLSRGKNTAITTVAKIMSGFAICYDIRFPELFRYLAFHGAKVIYVPSAFTHATGRHHWEVLLRARAIENQVFVVAANQVGESDGGAACYGHSMIVDPWGKIIAEAPGMGSPDAECVIHGEMDFREQENIRNSLPCLRHMSIRKIV